MSSVYSGLFGQSPSNSLNFSLHFEEVELRHKERTPQEVLHSPKAHRESGGTASFYTLQSLRLALQPFSKRKSRLIVTAVLNWPPIEEQRRQLSFLLPSLMPFSPLQWFLDAYSMKNSLFHDGWAWWLTCNMSGREKLIPETTKTMQIFSWLGLLALLHLSFSTLNLSFEQGPRS